MAELALRESIQGISRVALCGRLDISGAQDIETRFTAAVCPVGQPTLVDLSGVTFLSSMGIRVLIQVAKSLARHHARLALYAPTAEVKAVLSAAGLDTVLVIADTEPQAIEALRSA